MVWSTRSRLTLCSGWLPRLERLAELRGLDQFEKNVLLFLTGSVVSKNLRNTGKNNKANSPFST